MALFDHPRLAQIAVEAVKTLSISPAPLLKTAHANLNLKRGKASLSGRNDVSEYFGDAFIKEYMTIVLRRRKSRVAVTLRFLKVSRDVLCSNIVFAELMRQGEMCYPGTNMASVETKALGDLFEFVVFKLGKTNTYEDSVSAIQETFDGLIDVFETEFYKHDGSNKKRPATEGATEGTSRPTKKKRRHAAPNAKGRQIRFKKNRHFEPNENAHASAKQPTAQPARPKEQVFGNSSLVDRLPLVEVNPDPMYNFWDFVGSTFKSPTGSTNGPRDSTGDPEVSEAWWLNSLDWPGEYYHYCLSVKKASRVDSDDASYSRSDNFGDLSCGGVSGQSSSRDQYTGEPLEAHTHWLRPCPRSRHLDEEPCADRSRKPWLEDRNSIPKRHVSSSYSARSPHHRREDLFDDRYALEVLQRFPAPTSWFPSNPDDGYRRHA